MTVSYSKLSQEPIRLESNRVWRTYSGGKTIETWQGLANPQDSEFPEEWVASLIRARNSGREHLVNEGLSQVTFSQGVTLTLKELIETEPEAFLGAGHVQKYGANPAVLVKVLDSRCRLSIQVHPDREFAARVFNSRFGKTEAWYVLGGRKIDGEEPYLLFGFKPGMTRDKWRDLFERQDIAGMVDSLHRVPVVPGETLLIEGGLPHAIGPGCFLVEIQEPTDYTIRVERTTPEGKVISDFMCHQGAGFDKVLDCFHYDSYSLEETLARWRIPPSVIRREPGGSETELVGVKHTDKFRLHSLNLAGMMEFQSQGAFSVLIVLSGAGRISYPGGALAIRQSDQIFLPASLSEFKVEAEPGAELSLVRCFAPR